ncbi:uncharacterized protein LOC143922307 [Arctopsyche grandis]|uniref:uncharacterized protein LOC143922307 n=1 Tax=Arctopsyche grandis TaxID=121162 RepID=UPI00406D896C
MQKGARKVRRENSRDARNKAEKQRRDRLNKSINELATLLPLVAESSKKIDKTGILRLTAHNLRQEHVFGNTTISPMDPSALAAEAIVELLGGFLITVTWKGLIVVVTSNIEKHLGHCKIDLLGYNIINLIHNEDVEMLKYQLMPKTIPMGPNNQLLLPLKLINNPEKLMKDERRSFYARMARATQRSESPKFELCHFEGALRIADKATTISACHVRRNRPKGEDTVIPNSNDVVFIGMVRVMRPACLSERLAEAAKLEYRTRHLIDGRIVQCDQRISMVAGYMTNEIIGVSAFTFMHKDDVRWVIITLRQMYDCNRHYGESCYRLINRTGNFIHLKTKGYLEINQRNNVVESFVCLNTLVSEDEGMALINQMKKRYSVIVDPESKEYLAMSSSVPCVEDPEELEQAIMHLISDLPSPSSIRSFSPDPYCPGTLLSIIPPNPAAVKTAIAKSISVINQSMKSKSVAFKKAQTAPVQYTPSSETYQKTTVIKSRQDYVDPTKFETLFPIVDNLELFPTPEFSIKTVSSVDSNLFVPSPDLSSMTSNILQYPTTKSEMFQSPIIPDNLDILNTLTEGIIQAPPANETFIPIEPSIAIDTLADCENLFYGNNLTTDGIFNECDNLFYDDLMANQEIILNPESILNPEIILNAETILNPEAVLNPETGLNCETIMSSEVVLTPEIILNTDPILNSLDIFHPDENYLETDSFVNYLSGIKRSSQDLGETSASKRKIPSTVSSSDLIPNLETIFDNNDVLDPNNQQCPLNDQNIPGQSFDKYINQLTDPNSDLCEVVPRSLAALESSMIEMDDNVLNLNTQNEYYEDDQQQNLSDIIMEHEEQKQVLESIQLDYENTVTDSSDTTELNFTPTQNLD